MLRLKQGLETLVRSSPLVLLILVFSSSAFAYSFRPSDAEWVTWPSYCKSRYVQTNIGTRSEFAGSVPEQTQRKWRRILGSTFIHIHHYCAGILHLKRADMSFDAGRKKRAYRAAVGEIEYTYHRADQKFVLLSQMSAHLAMAYSGVGETGKAIRTLQSAIKQQPDKPQAYLQLAKMAAASGDEDEAIRVLKQGLNFVRYKSYLLHVKLAKIFLEMNEYESAKYHSDKAYATGYRAPGLKRKIAKANKQAKNE